MKIIYVLILLGLLSNKLIAQQTKPQSMDSLVSLPDKYLNKINSKTVHASANIDKRTEMAINAFIRREQKMQIKMAKIDSVKARNIFNHSIDSLQHLKAMLQQKLPGTKSLNGGPANAYIDTLKNTLGFLKDKTNATEKYQQQLQKATENIASLKDKMQVSEEVQSYLNEHKQMLKTQLSKYNVFDKDLKAISKQTYYYKQQINEYKSVITDKSKMEEKALTMLKNIPAYKSFIQQNSMFASLFNFSEQPNVNISQEGLQSRSDVEQLIQQRMGGNSSSQQAVSQQIEQAKAQMNELKNKLPGATGTADMPDFKPNEMKSKSLLQRLEFGANIQFQKSTQYFPNSGDVAGQIAYKLHQNGSIGLGLSYRLGLGTGWSHISLTHQGVGVRSFVDWKLKKSFYINGGYELNYNTVFNQLSQLKAWKGWQGSALFGISKKYKISSKIGGSVILLYDFLARSNSPASSPIKIRTGYNF